MVSSVEITIDEEQQTAHKGSAENEILRGTDAAEVIDGRGGNDTLIGNSGADVFVLSGGDDVIQDFEMKVDSLRFPKGLDYKQEGLDYKATAFNRKNIVITHDYGQLILKGLASHEWDVNVDVDLVSTNLYDFDLTKNTRAGADSPSNTKETVNSELITKPSKFRKKFIEIIRNFNPSADTLEIDTDSFGIDSSATFAATKSKNKVRNILAKQDFDFLYDEKKGGLYFNENGVVKGFGDGGIIAILKGAPKLTVGNFEFKGDAIYAPKRFKRKSADRITKFNISSDTLEIDADSFGIDSSATFAAGKNIKAVRKLAKKDFDFLYDQKKGGLYFNENGSDKGFGDGGIIAILKGAPDLTSGNLEFI